MEMSDKGHISELVQDDKNFNKHSEYGMGLLEKSIEKFGMGRSILVDKNNKIIAGNGITETAGNVGIEDVQFVDTDGKKIIAVRRTDIDLDTPEGREMALADNATSSANLKWDAKKLKEAEEQYGINKEEWGVYAREAVNAFNKEVEKSSYDVADYPITILNSKTEYEKFMKIKEELGLANNGETFAFIMNEFYTKHLT